MPDLQTFSCVHIATGLYTNALHVYTLSIVGGQGTCFMYGVSFLMYSWCGQSQTWWDVELPTVKVSWDYQYYQMLLYLCATMHQSKHILTIKGPTFPPHSHRA